MIVRCEVVQVTSRAWVMINDIDCDVINQFQECGPERATAVTVTVLCYHHLAAAALYTPVQCTPCFHSSHSNHVIFVCAKLWFKLYSPNLIITLRLNSVCDMFLRDSFPLEDLFSVSSLQDYFYVIMFFFVCFKVCPRQNQLSCHPWHSRFNFLNWHDIFVGFSLVFIFLGMLGLFEQRKANDLYFW